MTDPIVSATAFKWIVTLMTAIVAGTWFLYDGYKLIKLAKLDGKDPTVHDKRFGYTVGMVIGFIGVWGCLRFHDVL